MANCAKCGADVPIGATKCEYCGSVIDLPRREGFGAAPLSATRFKRVSIGLMVIYAIITLGVYLSAWFYVRRKQLAELSPKIKNARYLFGSILCLHIIYALGFLGYLGDPDGELLSALQMLWYLIWAGLICSSFVVRAALAELSEKNGSDFANSVIWAVLFNSLYLQSCINGMLDARILDKVK